MSKTKSFGTLEELEWNLPTYFPELKEIIEKPPIENPFRSSLRLGYLDRIKMGFVCFLVPFRFMLLGFALLLAYVVAYMCQLGVKVGARWSGFPWWGSYLSTPLKSP